MANAKVSILITGLAFCKPTDVAGERGQLDVSFLHPDRHHKIKLTIKEKIGMGPVVERPVVDLDPGDALVFQATDSNITSSGNDRTKVVNIFAKHRDAGVRVDFRNNPIIPKSQLTIPSSQFFSQSETELFQEFWIHDTGRRTKTLIPRNNNPVQVSKTIQVDFEIPIGKSLTFRRTVPNPVDFPLVIVPDVTYTVLLDNTCHDHSCGNDFGYYYEFLDSGGVEIEQFTLRRAVTSGTLHTLDAACNPVWADPPF